MELPCPPWFQKEFEATSRRCRETEKGIRAKRAQRWTDELGQEPGQYVEMQPQGHACLPRAGSHVWL